MHARSALFLPLLGALLLGTCAPTATLDAVDVQRLGDELVASRNGAPATRVRLERKERVAWILTRGTIGAALTGKRLLAVSPSSSGWRERRLDPGERLVFDPALGANVLVVATNRRVLGFHGPPGLWSELRLQPGERTTEVGAADRVGVAVTTRRAVGFAAAFAEPKSEPFEVRGSVESVRVLATLASIRTTQRLLVFDATLGQWRTEDEPVE